MKLKVFVILSAIALTVFSFLITPRPMISVVMATWNRKDMVRQAIESILTQTFRDFEFIIIDDASTDGTAELVAEYAKKDKRIIYLPNTENKGLVYNLNKGLDVARGKYIARMDDDDISLPERFEKQFNFMERYPAVTVLGTFIYMIDRDNMFPFHRDVDPDVFKIHLYVGNLGISHPTLMIRRDFLEKHKIRYTEKYKFAEDRPFYGDILRAGGQIQVFPEPLLRYRYFQSPKPEGYNYLQWMGLTRFHADFFAVFIPLTHEEWYTMPVCEKYWYMHRLNRGKKLVNQEKLDILYNKQCDGKNEKAN